VIGSPDDPSEAPTGLYDYGAADSDSAEPDVVPDPWYKNRLLVGLWVTAVALLIVLIVYGIVEISRGAGGGSTSTTTSSTSTRPSTTSSSTTSPSPTTETAPPPPPETPEQTPGEAPPQQGNDSPAPAPPPPSHHHHLPHIPLPHF
jgi:hypothetical protein